MKNIYQKLAIVRKRIANIKFEKLHENPYGKFKYFNLKDILPTVTDILTDEGLLTLFTYDDKKATLTLLNVDNPSEIIDMSMYDISDDEKNRIKANQKLMNAYQLIGSSRSYLQKYLYFDMFNISDGEINDPDSFENKEIDPVAELIMSQPGESVSITEIIKLIKEKFSGLSNKDLEVYISKAKAIKAKDRTEKNMKKLV